MASMGRNFVKVPRSFVETTWMCRICSKIITNPLSIPECLHIFCSKCIRGVIIKERVNKCPICQTKIGCPPLDKLRVDHGMASLRKRFIIPDELSKEIEKELPRETRSKEVSREVPEPTFPLPLKKKERSLSSLGKPSSFSKQSVRTKSGSYGRKGIVIEEPGERIQKRGEKSSSRFAGPKRSMGKGKAPITAREETTESEDESTDSQEHVYSHAETTREVNPANKSSLEGCSSRVVKAGPSEEETRNLKGKGEMTEKMSTLADGNDDELHAPPTLEQPRRTRRGRPRKMTVGSEEGRGVEAERVVDSASENCQNRTAPIWLNLVALNNQKGRASLSHVPAPYLRIKNGNLTVSFLKKYIMQKLVLDSEDEVEIILWGEPLPSSMKLYNLIDMYAQEGPTFENVETTVGASAKDFVIILTYGRKSLPAVYGHQV